jgi:transcriptional regulator with XRE-family HTH domain
MINLEQLADEALRRPTDVFAIEFGRIAATTRRALRKTQAVVGEAVGLSQPAVSLIEHGKLPGVSLRVIGDLSAVLGIQIAWTMRPPWVPGSIASTSARRVQRAHGQRDRGHARCSAYVRRRLERLGWTVAQEVEIVLGRSHGWIDILAFHAATGALLVGEIKTELRDLGEIQRTLAWYEREAWASARRLGWTVRGVVVVLFVLATRENDQRVEQNGEVFAQTWPLRSRTLARWLADPPKETRRRSGFVLIDPLSRRRTWLLGARLDGRVTPVAYADYRDFVGRLPGGRSTA